MLLFTETVICCRKRQSLERYLIQSKFSTKNKKIQKVMEIKEGKVSQHRIQQ